MKLKDLINERNESLEALSKKSGVSRQTFHNIEKGVCEPSLLTIKKICNYFGVDYRDYLED